MHCLTAIGKTILAPGFWGETTATTNGAQLAQGKLYLTFDDGPNPDTTPQLLALLAEEKVPATFFLIGSQIALYKKFAENIVNSGHAVGNHSYRHEFMPAAPLKRIQEDISLTNKLLEQISNGQTPRLFRPPFGILDNRVADYVRGLGMNIVYWTIVPEDWRHPGAKRVAERVTQRMSDGAIIVLHEGSSISNQTLEATKTIIEQAKAAGYEFSLLPDFS